LPRCRDCSPGEPDNWCFLEWRNELRHSSCLSPVYSVAPWWILLWSLSQDLQRSASARLKILPDLTVPLRIELLTTDHLSVESGF
jgi:hypothetical protein